MRVKNIFIVFLGLLLSCSFSKANEPIGFQFKHSERSVSFDIEVINNLVVIPVIMNRILKLRLILDTGVQHTILFDHELSPLFFIDPHRTVTIKGLGEGDELEASIATLVDMQIGEIKAKHKGLLILPDGTKQEINKYMGTEIHGLIGYDLFKDVPIKIDYTHKRITAYNPKYWKGKKRRYQKIPLNIREGKPYVKVDLKDRDESCEQCEVLIDSGSALGLSINLYANRKIEPDEPNIEMALGSGLIGDMSGKVSRVSSLDLELVNFKDVITAFPDKASVHFLEDKVNQTGSVGAGVLSRFSCIYDYKNAILHLKKTRRVRRPFKFNNTGIQIVSGDNDFKKVKIDGVIKNSPASDIGLMKGDYLLAVHSLTTEEMSLQEALGVLYNLKNGKTIRLLVQRGDEIFHTRLTTREII